MSGKRKTKRRSVSMTAKTYRRLQRLAEYEADSCSNYITTLIDTAFERAGLTDEPGPDPYVMAERARHQRPVCNVCKDTHVMGFRSATGGARGIPCTSCPTPCQFCRAGGFGAFCETTPCDCECHRERTQFRIDKIPSQHVTFGEP